MLFKLTPKQKISSDKDFAKDATIAPKSSEHTKHKRSIYVQAKTCGKSHLFRMNLKSLPKQN